GDQPCVSALGVSAPRAVSFVRQGLRRNGGRGSAPSLHAVRPLSQEVWRLSAPDPSPGREGLFAPEATLVAHAATWARRRTQVRRKYGVSGRALLPESGRASARRLGAAIAHRTRRSRGRPREPRA